MSYKIGQIFENDYPTEAVKWANENNAYILQNGTTFTIMEVPVRVPTEEEIQSQLTQAVQAMMDAKAQEKNYDNIHTACTYANSTDETFRKEGIACVAWRDAVWRKCYDILAEVKAGKRAIPTIEELIAELPELEW